MSMESQTVCKNLKVLPSGCVSSCETVKENAYKNLTQRSKGGPITSSIKPRRSYHEKSRKELNILEPLAKSNTTTPLRKLLPANNEGSKWITEERVTFPLATTVVHIKDAPPPAHQVPLETICPGENCDRNTKHEWTCRECLCISYYGFDDHVYCRCGSAAAYSLRFKCPGERHGNEYLGFKGDLLLMEISKIKPPNEMNILILGETGVGKSTWINGFMNFVTYNSLQDAKDNKLLTLVPTKFSVYNERFEEIVVSTGEDKNEVLKDGESATQETKVYPFNMGKTIIRIIDTPGIGDTRGIDTDKKNFENIINTIANLKELHGICILLKPNNARLSIMFRFCIKELLTYLHRDAAHNIMFCFTNSRSTLYRPGDTMPSLIKLLNENEDVKIVPNVSNVYCYDSEAYRFLASIKNEQPVVFTDAEEKNFADSWHISVTEVKRMLTYIRTLTPHPITSSLNLNHARQLVIKLARPLAEINKNIKTNKSIVEDKIREIQETNENIGDLEAKRKTTITVIETTKIDYPKTVCSNVKCVNVLKIPGTKTSTYEYKTVCHAHCALSGSVAADSIGHPGLMHCAAIDSLGNCYDCKHSYREHLHVYYNSKQVPKVVDDVSVVKALAQKVSAKKMKEMMIEDKRKIIGEYEIELKTVEEASAIFACFLKHNAITPYNDAVEQYLQHFIKEEEDKVKEGGSTIYLQNLRDSLESYKIQKQIIEDNIALGVDVVNVKDFNPESINERVDKLKMLKHSGKALKEALECINYSGKQEFRKESFQPVYTLRRRTRLSDAVLNYVNNKIETGLRIYKEVRSKSIF